ncbi:hypothetical protein VRK_36130 [Vibrio sp. MEBiC08052]|nr:hypothetical protein VRK_36130 [Vibrio sp. MEBiC08052]
MSDLDVSTALTATLSATAPSTMPEKSGLINPDRRTSVTNSKITLILP